MGLDGPISRWDFLLGAAATLGSLNWRAAPPPERWATP